MQTNSDGVAFEQYVKSIFERMGLRVFDTPASGDYGADLIFTYRNKRFSVQCKFYSGAVGVHAVQEVFSSLSYYGASYGIVITNSIFTQQAMTLAAANSVLTIDGNTLRTISCVNGCIPILDQFMRRTGEGLFVPQQARTGDDLLMSDLEIRYGVSASTIRQNFMAIGMPYYKIGHQYHFRKNDLRNWELRQRYVKINRNMIELPEYTKCRQSYQYALESAVKARNNNEIQRILDLARQYNINIDTGIVNNKPNYLSTAVQRIQSISESPKLVATLILVSSIGIFSIVLLFRFF